MQLPLYNQEGVEIGSVPLDARVFGCDYHADLVHQVYVSYRNAGRAGTAAQKNRAAVSGGGSKPWKQKGTGRARAGTTRGPIWVGGGVTFARSGNANYAAKVNKKMYRLAMRSLLSTLLKESRILIVDHMEPVSYKTGNMVRLLGMLKLTKGVIISNTLSENLLLAVRNIPHISLCLPKHVNPVVLVHNEKAVLTKAALDFLQEWLSV